MLLLTGADRTQYRHTYTAAVLDLEVEVEGGDAVK